MFSRIQSWVDDPGAPPIFWLHGMAGLESRQLLGRLPRGLIRGNGWLVKDSYPVMFALGPPSSSAEQSKGAIMSVLYFQRLPDNW